MHAVNPRPYAFILFGLALAGCNAGGGSPAQKSNVDGGSPAPGDADAGSPAPATDAGGLPPNFDAGVPVVTTSIPLTRCTGQVISADGVNGPLYTANVTLGTQTFAMLLDTGSSEMAAASSACSDCTGVSPLYAPGPTATDLKQTQIIPYGGQGSISGELYQENAQVGSEPSAPITLLAVRSGANALFNTPLCETNQGIFGLASPLPGETDYFPQLASHDGVPDVFAIGFCPNGGSLWLGGFDPTAVTGAPQFTPLDGGGNVVLSGITVGSTALSIPALSLGPMLVDTGNPLLRLGAFDSVTAAIARDPSFQKLFGDATWFANRTCTAVSLSATDLDSTLPPLTLTFGSNPSISVRASATSSYLQAQTGNGGTTWCPGLADSGSALTMGGGNSGDDAGLVASTNAGTLGDAFLRSSVVIWDRQSQRMGFAPHGCP